MRILITGINGFIGKHLADKLTQRGHIVLGIGNDKRGVLNPVIVEKEIRNAEIVIHLAAKTSHKEIVDNKFETLEINLNGTKNVLDAFIKSGKTKKFIYPSTGKVYGNILRFPISEKHPTNPLNTLGKSKLITEKLIDFYSNNQKEFIIFRIFNVYGKGQKENFLIPTILKQVDQRKKEITLGDIKAKRDYVYIDDLINAFILAVENNGKKGLSIYNICTGDSFGALQIVKLIEKIKGKNIKVKSSPALVRRDEMKDEYGSFAKAKKTLGWKPKVSLEEGLKKIITSNMQAIILAGGKGTRMVKKFPNTPKLLIPLKGKPFLDHEIERLKMNGVQDIIVCTGYLADKIKDYIKKKDYGVSIKLTLEKKPLGTGGALNFLKDAVYEDFFLLFGDVYSEINLKKMFAFHKKKKAIVTAAIHPSKHSKDSNLVTFNSDSRITKILKKPHTKIPKNPYNLAALYIVNRKIKKYLLAKTPYDFEHDLLIKLINENVPIYGYNTEELTMDFGTPKRLSELERLLRK